MRPPIPSIALSRRAKIALSTAAILVVLIIALVQLTGVYINFLWFDSVGFRGVYTTVFWTRLSLFFIFGVLMALIIGGNLIVAYLLSPPFRPMSPEQQNIERYRAVLEPRRMLLLAVISLMALFIAGLSAQGGWATWQLWLHGGNFGIKDPQFGRDISFFAWDYPAYRAMLAFGFSAIIFAFVLSAVVHYLTGAIRLQTPGPKVTQAARRHLTVLAFVFIVLKAIAYWLDRYGLVFSDRSKFTGASYTDVHAVLPARTILFWIALVIAAGLIASLWLRSTLLPGIAFVSMLVLSILISGIYPTILQQVSVKPNASSKEAPYISRNITATREAYKIVSGTDVNYVPYAAAITPKTSVLSEKNNATLDNVRILDPNVISPTVTKFQQGGNVYGFAPKLDVDRYTIGGVEHDYIVGVRELDAANLQGDQTNWINEHTNYTHGYGFVAAEANLDITNDGNKPGAFTEGGIPPTGKLKLAEPVGVYYGELLPDYSIVGAKGSGPLEFNGSGSQKVTYSGGGGVSLGSLFTRLAFAVNYKQSNFVLNNAASASGAKIIFNRDPRVAVQKVAPFLKVDGDPYPIVDGSGHIQWMVDGYTTMDNFPYSERQSLSALTNDSLVAQNKTAKQPDDTVNYIRNSVKATVDAYTGKVTLYRWDESDPVLKAWTNIFPGLVKPKKDMPTSISSHVRYPQDLFQVQRAMLGQYHVDDPVTFYNTSDKWTVPDDPATAGVGSQPPYYVLAAPAATSAATADQSVFQLTSPMNVNRSTYLAAYLSVDSDPNNYGKITALRLPRGSSAVQAPEQVYNKITTNTVISRDLTLFNGPGGGSSIVHGNLLTLPMGNSFLYVEPLYNQSSSGGGGTYPVLVRVIAVYGDNVGYGASLSDALGDLQAGTTGGKLPGGGGTGVPNPSAGSSGTTSPPATSSGSQSGAPQQVTLNQLAAARAQREAALKSGDQVLIAQAEVKEQKLWDAFIAQQGLPSSSSPSTSPQQPTASTTR